MVAATERLNTVVVVDFYSRVEHFTAIMKTRSKGLKSQAGLMTTTSSIRGGSLLARAFQTLAAA